MLLPAPPYADYPARLLALRGLAAQAYAAHVQHPPSGQSSFDAYLKQRVAAYEVEAALAEQNPAWVRWLLPTGPAAAAPVSPTGLPLVPAGVLAQVDVPRRDVVTLTVDVAAGTGVLGGTVSLFNTAAPAGNLVVAAAPTRATTSFRAVADGIYVVQLTVGGAPLATLYVLVCRAAHKLLREDSRALGYSFDDLLPRPSPVLLARLARLAAAEAACRTQQPELAARLVTSALALPPAPTPTAVFPRPRHA